MNHIIAPQPLKRGDQSVNDAIFGPAYCMDRGGTFENSEPSPSAIVGCARMASRSLEYGRSASIVAPDLPGFGQSDKPARSRFTYTFDNIAKVIERFTEVIGLTRFAVYVFDYGAPTGFRLAVSHPERIAAIISQNGNAYEEGLSEGRNPIQKYWKDPSPANRDDRNAGFAAASGARV